MKNKRFLLLIMALLFVSTVVGPVEAKKTDYESSRQANTAGVQGNEGDVLKAVEENKDIETYRVATDEGKIKFKAIVDMFHDIRNEKENYCKSLSKDCFKGTANADDSKKLLKLRGDKKKQQEYKKTCYFFVDKVVLQSITDKQDKMQEMADDLAKEAEAYKDGNCDQVDVEPVKSSSLENGELVAWGVPGIPRIPTPRPKATSSSSSSSTTPAQQKEVSDQGYKALRSVEMESEKVTEPEKDQFISELNSRVGSN